MSAHDRTTPKQIKVWCLRTLKRYVKKKASVVYGNEDVVRLMVKAYMRCRDDERSG